MNVLTLFSLASAISAADSTGVTSPGRVPAAQDSIYSLAVKPSDFPNEGSVMLLDEGVYRVEADGRNTRTFRQVVQILRAGAAPRYREQSWRYEPAHQELKVNWMKVVRADGEIISAEPAQVQESDIPAAMQNPTYVASKVRRMSLAGLDTGTILDWSVTIEERKPFMEGDFLIGWRVTGSIPLMRSNLVVDVPAAYNPRITERNLNFKRSEHAAGGRKRYVWATSNVSKQRVQLFTPDSLSPAMTITVSPSFDWRAIGKWYVPIARDAYAITPLVERKITAVVAGAHNREDSIRAIHRWVAQDIRYVAIELGRGGYVPRSAESVVQTGFGDCKDKAMLFLAALRRLGVAGYPVLLNAFGGVRGSSPALEQLNHMIAAVRTGEGYTFADLTAGGYQLGQLPPSEGGSLAILVKESDAEEIRLPLKPVPEGSTETLITGKLAEDGGFTGAVEQHFSGSEEWSFRDAFAVPPDSIQRSFLARSMARRLFDDAEGDSLEWLDGKDFTAPARVRVRVSATKVVSQAGSVQLLTNPLKPLSYFTRMSTDLQKEQDRTAPIDLRQILGPVRTHTEVRIKLPSGWRATLPKNESAAGPPGSYTMTYAQVGDELRITRTLTGTRDIAAANRMPDVITWLKAVGHDDSKLIVLQNQ